MRNSRVTFLEQASCHQVRRGPQDLARDFRHELGLGAGRNRPLGNAPPCAPAPDLAWMTRTAGVTGSDSTGSSCGRVATSVAVIATDSERESGHRDDPACHTGWACHIQSLYFNHHSLAPTNLNM